MNMMLVVSGAYAYDRTVDEIVAASVVHEEGTVLSMGREEEGLVDPSVDHQLHPGKRCYSVDGVGSYRRSRRAAVLCHARSRRP